MRSRSRQSASYNHFVRLAIPCFSRWCFQVSGGVDYAAAVTCYQDTVASCQSLFLPVVVAQVILWIVATIECYILLFRLTHVGWLASIATTLGATNLYLLQWERLIMSEALSYWCLVSLFLCFDFFMRRPHVWSALLFALFSFMAIMIRPFNVYIPLLLLVLAFLQKLLDTAGATLAHSGAVGAARLWGGVWLYAGERASESGIRAQLGE